MNTLKTRPIIVLALAIIAILFAGGTSLSRSIIRHAESNENSKGP